ncbi:MAG TPA: TIM barrel protein [Verrucomicrobiae bacterium]|nr:TIM barrel protein [Verrucomicrobiae bacterium]
MNRRDVIRALGASAALAVAGLPARAKAEPSKLKGRIKQCLTRGMFSKMPIDEFCKTIKEIGLLGVDLVKDPKDWAVIRDHGLIATMVPGGGAIKKGINDKSLHPQFLQDFKNNIKAAAEFKWPNVIALAGDREGISDAQSLDNCVEILKEASKIAEDAGVTICMELLNSKVNHPGYVCDKTAWGVELCKRVNSPRCKLLYDIYHMQIMEGDIIRTITDNIQYIAHFHTAGNPGRKDLDNEQELNYPPIMQTIAKLTEEGKFSGYVAHEFSPKKGVESLKQAVLLCDV